jgi:hypothetical protein
MSDHYAPYPKSSPVQRVDISTSGFDGSEDIADRRGIAWWKVNGERYEVRVDSFADFQRLDALIKAKQALARYEVLSRVSDQLEVMRRNVNSQL